MDTLDRPDVNLPARLQPGSSRLPAQIHVASRELAAAAPPSPVNSRLLWRGLMRHWWHILLLWLVVSIPGVYLVYSLIEPTYDASSTLRIEPSPELFGPSAKGIAPDFGQYLETQRALILSNRVLEPAVANIKQDPGYQPSKFPVIRESNDPKSDVRRRLGVSIVPNTYLIHVAFSSPSAIEAAEVVNQVVAAFDQENRLFNEGMNGVLKINYEKYLKELDTNLAGKRKELKELAGKGNVEFSKPKLSELKKNAEGEDAPQPAFETLAYDQYKRTTDMLLQTEIDLIDAESRYQMLEAEAQTTSGNLVNQNSAELQKRIEEESFKSDPEVASLIEKMNATNDDLEHTTDVARKAQEPARIRAQKYLKKLNDKYVELWNIKSKEIRKRILIETGARSSGESLSGLKRKIDTLRNSKKTLQELLVKHKDKYKDDKQSASKDAVEATFVRDEVVSLTEMNNSVKRKLEQLKFESQRSTARLYVVDAASAAKSPSVNKRQRFMMMLPVGVLFAVLSLFLLLEIKAERVADPDLLSSRVQSEVFALPPLPTSRAPRSLSGPDDQIDKFIQRLDHLRFAVCGGQQDAGLGRCVLVTSAIGGEGKTTLAAQLAARCGNAGISTLLIDAELRRAALCDLLDVPEGPGLSDVLKNEANVDEIVIPVQGGTFHLLAAGTPIDDTSRILQGRNFAILIAQLRQRYDMIIIDSPPILPVPDGLILGRWTDGALLAARFEVSRSPQVERARRQLDSAGIPVLGTVINGMRSSDAYYGRYAFSRQRPPQPDSPGTI